MRSMPSERLVIFDFTVNKSFIDQGHAITIPQHLRPAVLGQVGHLYRNQRTITIVSATGMAMEGTIRHSINNKGPYLQLGCRDPEAVRSVSKGQVIKVELRRDEAGLSFWLDPPPPNSN